MLTVKFSRFQRLGPCLHIRIQAGALFFQPTCFHVWRVEPCGKYLRLISWFWISVSRLDANRLLSSFTNRASLNHVLLSTVGSWLSKLWLSVSERLDVTIFSGAAGKDVLVTGVLLQEKAKVLYERLFPDATTHFLSSKGLWSQFTMSELAERSCARCSTLYYSVAH